MVLKVHSKLVMRAATGKPSAIRGAHSELREWFCLNCQTLQWQQLQAGVLVCVACGTPIGRKSPEAEAWDDIERAATLGG